MERTEDTVKLDRIPMEVDTVEPMLVDKELSAYRVMFEKVPMVVEMLETVDWRLSELT